MRIKKGIISLLMVVLLLFTSASTYAYATEENAVTDTEDIKAPVYDITINIVPDRGWLTNTSRVNIKVIDNQNTGTFQLKKLEAKVGADGKWEDITDKGYIEVSENCSVYAVATDAYGNTYSKTRYLDGYDLTPPTFNVAVNNGVMTIETHDSESGVEAIYINGYKYKPNKNGKLTVRLQKFDASYATFTVYVVDASGNESDPYTIDNPYFKQQGTEDDNSVNPSDSLPDNASPNVNEESSAQINSVTDEYGNDISEDVNTKQFYTITTKNGQQLYLVIDMSAGEYFEGSADTPATVANGTVYLLTYVSNDDLLNMTGSDEVTLGYNSIAAGNKIDENAETEHAEPSETTDNEIEDSTEDDKEESSGGGTVVWIIVIIIAGVFVVIFVKGKVSGKSRIPSESDDEDDEEEFEEVGDDYETDANDNNEG